MLAVCAMQTTGLFTALMGCTVLGAFINVLGIVFAGKEVVVRPAAETLLTVDDRLNAG